MVWKGNWPDEVKAFALKSAADGKSANAISAQILRIFNVDKSRNAVIGLVHRSGKTLGTNGRASMSANGKRTGPMAAAIRRHRMNPRAPIQITPRFAAEPLPPTRETDVPRVSFLDLDETSIAVELENGATRIVRSHCKFVCLPEPAAPHVKQFCGDERVEGLAYCAEHAARCYGAPPPRRENSKVAPIKQWVRRSDGSYRDLESV